MGNCKLAIFVSLLLFSSFAYAQPIPGRLTIEEEDGSPSGAYWKLQVSNGTLTENSDYSGTISTSGGSVSDAAYGVGWNGDTTVAPSKNAVYDKIETLGGGHDAVTLGVDADVLLGLSTQQLILDTQAANTVFAGPGSGVPADPTFRALVDDDVANTITLDSLTQITTRSHTALSDIGTNTHSTIDTHLAATNPHSDSLNKTLTSANIYVGSATNVATGVAMSGDVAIDNAGAATIQDNSVDGTDIALGSDAQGDVMFYDGTNWVRLGAGTAGNFLQTNGAAANVTWNASAGSGDITSVGDVASGAAFDGTQGTIITFNNAGGDKTLDYDGTDFLFNAPLSIDATDPADAGAVRLDNAENIAWEASPAGTDMTLGVDASEILQYSGNINATAMTENGNAVYNSAEVPGGELGGTFASFTIDDSVTVTGWELGASTATTPAADDNDTSLATTAYTQTELNAAGGRSISCASGSCDADAETYTDTKCIYFESPVATDDFKSIWYAKNAATLTSIWAESDQTVTFMLQVDDGTPADCDSVDLAPAAGTAEDTALDGDATMAAGDRLDLAVTSVASTPTWCSICFTFTRDD